MNRKIDDVQVVTLPYGINGRLRMVVMLPDKSDGLEALEERLNDGSLMEWISDGRSELIDLYLPRFRLEGRIRLRDELMAVGLRRVFSGELSELTEIARSERLYVDDAIHKAFVDVNERGTEAAAATALIFGPGGLSHTPQPIVVRADHPFLFVIHDQLSDAIVFMGRVVDPGKP